LVPLALLLLVVPATWSSAQTKNFRTHLTGAEEAPIPRETPAQGQAIFQVNDDGTISFRLNVANIDNVFAAHIHCGAAGVAGPVGVTLFTGPVGGGTFNGVLSEGTLTAPDPGNACGWTSLSQVLAAMEAGTAYVNVHTNDGVAPANTGPGDFPGGEIRGQI
jgi:hypothetical protein